MPEADRLGLEEPLEKRVELLVDTTCYIVFAYIAQGLFERHKLIVATQLCMSILKGKGELNFMKFDYLLRGPKVGTGRGACSRDPQLPAQRAEGRNRQGRSQSSPTAPAHLHDVGGVGHSPPHRCH